MENEKTETLILIILVIFILSLFMSGFTVVAITTTYDNYNTSEMVDVEYNETQQVATVTLVENVSNDIIVESSDTKTLSQENNTVHIQLNDANEILFKINNDGRERLIGSKTVQ